MADCHGFRGLGVYRLGLGQEFRVTYALPYRGLVFIILFITMDFASIASVEVGEGNVNPKPQTVNAIAQVAFTDMLASLHRDGLAPLRASVGAASSVVEKHWILISRFT